MKGSISDSRLFTELRTKIKKNKALYLIARGIIGGASETRYQLLRGYYEYNPEVTTLIVRHLGEKNPDRIIYYLVTGDNAVATGGFYALLRWVLYGVGYAEKLGMTPVVKWGKHTHYYDRGMDKETENVFEYYYEPVSDIFYQEAGASQNVVFPVPGQAEFVKNQFKKIPVNGYLPTEEEIAWLGEQYKKYLHLNDETQRYLKQIEHFIHGKLTIGVHIRGTDFKKGYKGHPVPISPEEYLTKAKELLRLGKYEQIFLATDDIDVLKIFREGIAPECLIYYGDVFRSEGNIGVHDMESDRPLHRYRLGLESLRDVYTLASCDGLIVGLSQVSFAARYIAFSMNRHFGDLIVLHHGINKDGSVVLANEPIREK